MRVRLVRKGDSEFMVIAEVGSGKGKKSTSGNKVTRKGLKAEAERLVKEVRGE